MNAARHRRPRPPLDQARLEELALSYIGRFATTRSKLRLYLNRKLRERGWEGGQSPDVEGLAERYARAGLIDDSAFALAKAQSFARRGYGHRRLSANLAAAGVEEDDRVEANAHAEREAAAAALRFAERKRIGPFATEWNEDRKAREKAVAAMVRAGHSLNLALAIVKLAPGEYLDPAEIPALD